MERSPFEVAFHNFRNRDPNVSIADFADVDIIQQTAIASNVDLSLDRSQLRVVLGGIDQEGFDLEGGRQAVAGDTLIVTREDLSQLDIGWRLRPNRPERASTPQGCFSQTLHVCPSPSCNRQIHAFKRAHARSWTASAIRSSRRGC